MIHTLMMNTAGDTMATLLIAWMISSSWERTSWWLQLSIQVSWCHSTFSQSNINRDRFNSRAISQSNDHSYVWSVNTSSMPLASSHSTFWFSYLSTFRSSFMHATNQPVSNTHLTKYLSSRQPNDPLNQSFICFSTLLLNYPDSLIHPPNQRASRLILQPTSHLPEPCPGCNTI